MDCKVIDAFEVNGFTVLALDKKWFDVALKKKAISVDGNRIPFTPAHNDYWIVVPGKHILEGKTITFVN